MDVPDNELLEIALVENLQRKDLSPFEEADGYKALQERHGYTHEQIADAVGKSRVTITEALSISRLPDRVQAECRRADIGSRSFLLELGRLKDEDLMLAAVVAMASGETLSRDVLREVKKDARRGTSSKLGGMKKAYTLDFAPEDKRYKVSLVLKGRIHKKDEILEAIRDLARRIEAGDIDLEAQGRFVKAKARRSRNSPCFGMAPSRVVVASGAPPRISSASNTTSLRQARGGARERQRRRGSRRRSGLHSPSKKIHRAT